MKKQSGFTLIELVVVIVILGILAAVALPKFVGMTSEARIAKMKGGVGAVNAGAALIHAKWLASGSPTAGTIAYEGGNLAMVGGMVNGYPAAAQIAVVAGLGPDYLVTVAGTTATIRESAASACLFTYAPPAAAGGAPTVVSTALTAANCP